MTAEKKVTVAGNATLDALISGRVSIEEGNIVKVTSGDHVEEFTVDDPPIRAGHKHRVRHNIEEKIRPLWTRLQPGGGSYNSVTAMRRLKGNSELNLQYFDVAIPDRLITESLEDHKVSYHFFNQRRLPVNAILGWVDDKLVLKCPSLGRVKPEQSELSKMEGPIRDSHSILINGPKDHEYSEAYMSTAEKHGVPIYAVITPSTEPDFAKEKVLPRAKTIVSYDDLPDIMGVKYNLCTDSKIELARSFLEKTRADGVSQEHPIYVTLGKHGVLYAKKSSITHVTIKPEYHEEVQVSLSSAGRRANGAGDVFAAALTLHDTFNNRRIGITELVGRASEAAINYRGHNTLPREAFTVRSTYRIRNKA